MEQLLENENYPNDNLTSSLNTGINQTVQILLTRHYDTMSKIIYFITGRGYTHASIGLEEQSDCFYSFNYRGFCIEHPKHLKNRTTSIPSRLFNIEVEAQVYDEIKKKITAMNENRNNYSYSRLGVLLCVLHIPHRIENHYFCSQFVAELLLSSGALRLKKKPSLCLPNTFIKELAGYSNVSEKVHAPLFA